MASIANFTNLTVDFRFSDFLVSRFQVKADEMIESIFLNVNIGSFLHITGKAFLIDDIVFDLFQNY
jgi:hypothetical protein